MARIERKVEELVAEDAGMEDAVETVLDHAEEGEVKWLDVREAITSGQWGRLIESGVLVDGDEGFSLADREATRAALSNGTDESAATSTSTDDADDEGSSWSTYDKGAAVLTGGLFVGYSYAPVRNLIGGGVDVFLGPVAAQLPFYAVVMILALATGLYSTLLQANLMDTEKMAEYQEQMKKLQNRRKEAKAAGDDDALDQIQEEQMDAMGDQLGMFKEQFRPMVWIMFFTIPVFLWMYWALGIGGGQQHVEVSRIVMPLFGDVQWRDAAVGPIQAWILWYFACSMGFTQIIRKSLDIDMTPTTS